ncbi:MAG: hypothetical protein MZV70_03020 [Desulfobacterales bacterium]|nr:hypothetical protein [Desulfobacterales bacterium]
MPCAHDCKDRSPQSTAGTVGGTADGVMSKEFFKVLDLEQVFELLPEFGRVDTEWTRWSRRSAGCWPRP